jgi:methylmalonyl-CoA mutase N-terminal domain/subunit
VLGGAQSLHTNSFDEALVLPSERAATIALRTQQVIAHESGVASTSDPAGGSYFVEALTRELEERAWELIGDVDERGGAVAAIEAGWVQAEIEASAYRWTKAVEDGERVIVGVNAYVADGGEQIELHRVDPGAERRQIERAQRVRFERDAGAAERALEGVRAAARGTENLLPPIRKALRAMCTVGEVCGVLREEWGTYDR